MMDWGRVNVLLACKMDGRMMKQATCWIKVIFFNHSNFKWASVLARNHITTVLICLASLLVVQEQEEV